MEESHNYALNLVVPLMGMAPLLLLFILKGEKKTKSSKNWTRSTNQNNLKIQNIQIELIIILIFYY